MAEWQPFFMGSTASGAGGGPQWEGGHGRPTSLLPAGPYLGGHQVLVLISTIAARILCSTFNAGFRTSLLC